MSYTEQELRNLAVDDIIYLDVNSSIVESIAYDMRVSVLVVSLIGSGEYAYANYPFDEFVRFANDDSPGSFYNHFVKGHYMKGY